MPVILESSHAGIFVLLPSIRTATFCAINADAENKLSDRTKIKKQHLYFRI